MKVMIVSGGRLETDFLIEQIAIEKADMILCADSGANIVYKAGILPHVLLGDFDSVDQEVFQYFLDQKTKTVRYKAEKDVTDTEIAIEYAINQGATEITLLGVTGSRLDHTLANIFILEKYMNEVHCKILDRNNRIELLSDYETRVFTKNEFPYLSLIPISKKVKGVTTEGMKYPLTSAILSRKDSYGISNEIIDFDGSVSVTRGLLAVIQSRD